MDAHCALALPQITFIWIIHHGGCSIITSLLCLVFAFQRCCGLCFHIFKILTQFTSHITHRTKKVVHFVDTQLHCHLTVHSFELLQDCKQKSHFKLSLSKLERVIQNKNKRNYSNCSSHFNLLYNHGSHIFLFRVPHVSSHA